MNNYDLLIQRLDAFIRKFYLNQLIRGLLIFLASAFGIFVILNIGEYLFYFPALLKIILLTLLSLSALVAFYFWILLPLLKMRRLGKTISHHQAAKIIGDHFVSVQDKLLNILQLKANSYSEESKELVEAGIRQKTSEIMVVPFLSAINLKRNKKILPYLIPSLVLIAAIFLFVPDLFQTASARLMQPTTNFAPPAPFSYLILNKDLKVPLNGEFVLNVKVDGDKLPDQVFLIAGNEELTMEKKGKQLFSYTFKNVHETTNFHLEAAKVKSPDYRLQILEKPIPEGFSMEILYPPYTKISNQFLESMTDIVVPEGTVIKWGVRAKFTDQISMKFGDSPISISMQSNGGSKWNYALTLLQDTTYSIYLSNKNLPNADSFHYRAQVIEDQKPQVQLQEFKDTISGQQVLLQGQASDDYGLTELAFHYSVLNADKKKIIEKRLPLSQPSGKIFTFQHYIDLATIQLEPGQEIQYYVAAWDNDGLHGRKKGISEMFTYHRPDKNELDSLMKESSQQMNQSLSSSASQTKEIQEDMEKLRRELLQSQGMSWEQEQNMKSMLEKQMQLKDKVEALKKQFEQQRKQSEEKNFSEQVKDKQGAVEKQLDRLLNKELAEQLKKLQQLLEQKNKANAVENLQKMQEENKLFNMDLERIQALMKQLELQMKMENMANKLSDLAKEERALEQKTANQEKSNEALAKEQKEIQKELEKLMKEDFSAIEKANKEQDKPQDLDDQKDNAKDAQKQMEQSESQLQKDQKSSAQKAQDKAAQKLEKMSSSMAEMAGGMEMEQIDIDIKAVRQLLTNLLRFSFDQEALMEKEKSIGISSPLFGNHAKEQKKLKDNATMIKDSLFVLSKRVFQLAPSINKETTEMTNRINQSLSFLEDRRVGEARVQQQFAMSNANNLALLLNETLSNLMQSQAQMKGSGDPKSGKGKPGKGKPGDAGEAMKDIITGQEKLGEGMNKAKGEGKKPGESGKDGQSGSGGEGEGSAEQLARMAQQQAQLRKQIQELSSMLNSTGGSGQNAKLLKEIQEQMNKNETDLVNRRLSSDLIRRQKDILTRLLEAEKSIRNQEEDDKRASNTAKNQARPMPSELEKYLKTQQEFFDAYKTTPILLRPFYQKMSEDYLKVVK